MMFRNVALTVGTRVLLMLLTLLSAVISARFLAPADRGYFFFATTIAVTIAQFGCLGLHSSNVRYLAEDSSRLGVLAGNSLWVSLGVACLAPFVLAALVGVGWIGADVPRGVLAVALIMVPFQLYYLLASNLLVGLERFKTFNALELLNRVSAVLLFLACAWLSGGLSGFLVAMLANSAMISIWLWRKLHGLGGRERPDWNIFRITIGYGFRAYLAALLPFIMQRQIVFMLEGLPDEALLGHWSIASRLGDMLLIVPTSIAAVLFPRLMKSESQLRLTWLSAGFVAALMLVGCGVMAALAEPFIRLVFGKAYLPGVPLLYWYLPGIFCLCVIGVLSQLLAARGMPPVLLVIWAGGVILDFVLADHWLAQDGAVGAVQALSLSYVAVLAGVTILALRVREQPKV